MTHAALVSAVLFWLVVVLTLLLVMFIYAVIATPPKMPSWPHRLCPNRRR